MTGPIGGTDMESYTIRILYRNTDNPRKFVGVVEADGVAGKRGFVDLQGLQHILEEMLGGTDRRRDVYVHDRTGCVRPNLEEMSPHQ